MGNRISIHITTKDRHTELALVLESLRHQTFQDWDLIILDDASVTPINNCYFLQMLINQLKLENHKIKIIRNDFSNGCCYARNRLIQEDKYNNPLTLRLDDDIVMNSDYIALLNDSINKGYDMVTGIIPNLGMPTLERECRNIKIINEHKLDNEGNLIMNKDECAMIYLQDKTIPTHQFRTNCLYKSEINNKVQYPLNLTTVAFREEGFFSIEALIKGYKLAVRTGAIAYHLQCPSGGNRRADYAECVKLDDETFRKWLMKKFNEYGDFFTKYNEEVLQ